MSEPESRISMSILLVDDDADVRRALGHHLRDEGHNVHLSEAGLPALEVLRDTRVDIVITDVRMPGMDGFELLGCIKRDWPDTEVVVVTAYGDVDSAVRALREGAFDYFTKPFNVHDIAASLERTARYRTLLHENERFRERLDQLGAEGRARYGLDAIIGESQAIGQVKEFIAQIAQTDNTTVLVVGETGTGKELVARAIHYESSRARGPFIAVDCTAIPANLIESEFYGHVKGAFTDAREDRKGRFELADGGTLFLDEIGDMDLEMQAKLLRTLEERRVQRLGSAAEIPVDVRVISATNQDLVGLIEEGGFRRDLYYRLNTFAIRVPPLRERCEDILPLARHHLNSYAREMRKSIADFSPAAQALLAAHSYPGNVRELKNMVERAAILCKSDQVTDEELDFERIRAEESPAFVAAERSTPEISPAATLNLDEVEKETILRALQVCNGNRIQAARLLGISRDTLRRRMASYHISDPT